MKMGMCRCWLEAALTWVSLLCIAAEKVDDPSGEKAEQPARQAIRGLAELPPEVFHPDRLHKWADLDAYKALVEITGKMRPIVNATDKSWFTRWKQLRSIIVAWRKVYDPEVLKKEVESQLEHLTGRSDPLPTFPALPQLGTSAADRDQGGAGQDEGGTPADPYAELRAFARNRLRGQERAVLEALCDANGELSIVDLATKSGVNWTKAKEQFKDVRRRLNPKLNKRRWILNRVDNTAKLGARKEALKSTLFAPF